MDREMDPGWIRMPGSGGSVRRYPRIRSVLTDNRRFQPAVFVRSPEIKEEMKFLKQPFSIFFDIFILVNAMSPGLPELTLMQ
jgi:hypothetical protein